MKFLKGIWKLVTYLPVCAAATFEWPKARNAWNLHSNWVPMGRERWSGYSGWPAPSTKWKCRRNANDRLISWSGQFGMPGRTPYGKQLAPAPVVASEYYPHYAPRSPSGDRGDRWISGTELTAFLNAGKLQPAEVNQLNCSRNCVSRLCVCDMLYNPEVDLEENNFKGVSVISSMDKDTWKE